MGKTGKSEGREGCGLGCIVQENNFLKFFLKKQNFKANLIYMRHSVQNESLPQEEKKSGGNVKGKLKERKLVLVLVTPISKTSQTPYTISI